MQTTKRKSTMNKQLSHINQQGGDTMVDVSAKTVSSRVAVASGLVVFPEEVFKTLEEGQFTNIKGGIIQTAVIAGIQAVKKTADLIPLCHQLALSKDRKSTRLNSSHV